MRMAGVNIGKVKGKELSADGRRTVAELEIDSRFAPIARDTRAILRQKSLLGETYVELSPGHRRGGELRRRRHAGALAGRRHDRARRDLRRLRPGDAGELPGLARPGRHRQLGRLRARLQRLARQPGAVRARRRGPAAALGRAGGRARAAGARHRPCLRRRLRRERPAARADRQRPGDLRRARRRATRRWRRRSASSRPSCARRARRSGGWRRSRATPIRWWRSCAARRATSARRCAIWAL